MIRSRFYLLIRHKLPKIVGISNVTQVIEGLISTLGLMRDLQLKKLNLNGLTEIFYDVHELRKMIEKIMDKY